jgi:hypothetical protein
MVVGKQEAAVGQDANSLASTEDQRPKANDGASPANDQRPTTNDGAFENSSGDSSGAVLYFGTSDSPAQVLRPRFDALGGDASRLHLLRQEASFQFPVSSFPPGTKDKPPQNRKLETRNWKLIPLLAAALQQTRARLVIVDPLESCLTAEGIGPRSQKFRRWLDQLAGLAQQYNCCVLLVRTLSRSPSGRALAGGLGSLELAGVVRSHLVVGGSAVNPSERALIQVKSNWGRLGPPLGYTIDDAGAFRWTGTSTLTLEEMLAATPDDEQKSALAEAESFLQTTLAGGPQPASTVQQEAHSLGLARATLRRAKERLGVLSKKTGGGAWVWENSNKQQAASDNQESSSSAVLQSPDHRITRSSDGEADSDEHLEHLARTAEEEEEEYRAYLVERGNLVDDYLERTGQREPFKTNYGIDFQRLGAHFRPLYELIDRVAALDRPPKVPPSFLPRLAPASRPPAAAGNP